MKYEQFLASKRHSSGNYGFEAQWMPECAFDFQRFIVAKALIKGRIGIFADTGLGKTLIQVTIAENVIRQTFQSAPVIADGRTLRWGRQASGCCSVSIRARHR